MLSQKPWRAEAVIQLIAGVFVCLSFGVLAAGLLRQAGVAAFRSPDSFANILVATLSFQGAALILILIFLKQHDVNWHDALGLRNTGLKRSLAWQALFVAALVAAGVIAWVDLAASRALSFPRQARRLESRRLGVVADTTPILRRQASCNSSLDSARRRLSAACGRRRWC